ncbi:hypothetical protein BdWA1_000345 [Babesia duncani]|uniref:Uncharacterized protein n=1 Tax=Babesia duncani TaxID=323732 RepID=A0AAD9PMN4_9APIC|nr:hypothetical protein BdWA1_000345 [Babesia duncani]
MTLPLELENPNTSLGILINFKGTCNSLGLIWSNKVPEKGTLLFCATTTTSAKGPCRFGSCHFSFPTLFKSV